MRKKLAEEKEFAIVFFLTIFINFVVIIINSNTISKYVAVLVFFMSIISTYRIRKNWKLFIIYAFIMYSNYSVCMIHYIFPESDAYSFYTIWANMKVSVISINILLLFTSFLFLFTFVNKEREEIKINFFESNESSSIIVYVSIIILVFILHFGASFAVEGAERGDSSALFEYSLIIFIIAFYYSSTKSQRIALCILLFLFVGKDLLIGRRATAMQLLIGFFLIFVADYVKLRKIIPIIIIAFFGFNIVGVARANTQINISTLLLVWEDMKARLLADATSIAAYHTSMTYVNVLNEISIKERIYMSVRSFAATVFGSKLFPNADISTMTLNYYAHSYGGWFPFFGYFYFGYFGVILFGSYIFFILKKFFCENAKSLKKCLSIYIASTVPRWYLYSMSALFHGIILFAIIFLFTKIFHMLETDKLSNRSLL